MMCSQARASLTRSVDFFTTFVLMNAQNRVVKWYNARISDDHCVWYFRYNKNKAIAKVI